MDTTVLSKEAMSGVEVAKLVSDLGNKPDRAEVQNQVLGMIKKFARIKEDKAQKLKEELKALDIATFTGEHMAAIIDFMPRDLSELKMVFATSKTTIAPEMLEKMLGIVKKYQ